MKKLKQVRKKIDQLVGEVSKLCPHWVVDTQLAEGILRDNSFDVLMSKDVILKLIDKPPALMENLTDEDRLCRRFSSLDPLMVKDVLSAVDYNYDSAVEALNSLSNSSSETSAVDLLKEEFPHVDMDIIRDVLASLLGDIVEARGALSIAFDYHHTSALSLEVYRDLFHGLISEEKMDAVWSMFVLEDGRVDLNGAINVAMNVLTDSDSSDSMSEDTASEASFKGEDPLSLLLSKEEYAVTELQNKLESSGCHYSRSILRDELKKKDFHVDSTYASLIEAVVGDIERREKQEHDAMVKSFTYAGKVGSVKSVIANGNPRENNNTNSKTSIGCSTVTSKKDTDKSPPISNIESTASLEAEVRLRNIAALAHSRMKQQFTLAAVLVSCVNKRSEVAEASRKGHNYHAEMIDANSKAASTAIKWRNRHVIVKFIDGKIQYGGIDPRGKESRGLIWMSADGIYEICVDLHGVTRVEAQEFVESFLSYYQNGGCYKENEKTLRVHFVVGKGLHSSDGLNRIGPAVCRRLKEWLIRFTYSDDGVIRFNLSK